MSVAEARAEGAPVPIRLVTWNLNHWRQPLLPTDTRRAAWDYLAKRIGAHVALVQEAVPPLELARNRAVYGELAGHRNWGSAVVALDPAITIEPIRSVRLPFSRRRFLLENTHPGSVAIARLTVADIQPITLVSVYGVWDGPVVATMHRVIADLVPLFDSPQGARVILGGDLNVSDATTDAKYLARGEALLAAIRSLGLVAVKTLVANAPASPPDCPCGKAPTCGHIATWGSAELDHLFVTPSLASQVTAVTVDPASVQAGLSDHVPLVLDLALTTERTPHAWDEDSFTEEIGRRHGPAARDVIEKLVNWADRKERELTGVTGVRTKGLTRFPTNGITADPEMWWQVDLELAPRGVQYTICVRAKGDVVVQFGARRNPPFDDLAVRDELRLALNEMDGVDIPKGKLPYWPTFPLSVLEDPNLARLVAVLDRLATESHTVRPIEAATTPVELDSVAKIDPAERSRGGA